MKKLILLMFAVVLFPISFASGGLLDSLNAARETEKILEGKVLYCKTKKIFHNARSYDTAIGFNGTKGRLIYLKGYNIFKSPFVDVILDTHTITLGGSNFYKPFARISRETLDTRIKWAGVQMDFGDYKCSISSKEIVIENFKANIALVRKKNKI